MIRALAEKLEVIQRSAVGMISACLGVSEYKTSRGELEEWRCVKPECKSMGEGVWVRERHSCYLLLSKEILQKDAANLFSLLSEGRARNKKPQLQQSSSLQHWLP